ncbi:MAG TPA: hypothetical protein VHD15_10675, partial [Hyphomicrobiales bacterium]|nr:hypothetical protein [Hyphomicrobiales bacterium]
MVKVVYATLNPSKRRSKPLPKKVVTRGGKRVTLYTVDADSPTFAEDMTTAFRHSVAAARRENRRLLKPAGRAAA